MFEAMKVGIRTVSLFSGAVVVAGMQRLFFDLDWESGPELLVIAADHGEGTSGLSHALGEHPCLISVGETFDSSSQRWFSPTGENAFFKYDGRKGEASEYTKLQEHIDEALTLKHLETFNLSKNLERKHKTVHEFFKAVREEVCAHVELPSMCGSRCVMVHKLFPSWFSYNLSYVEDYLKSEDTMVLQVIRDEAAVIKSNKERFNMGDSAIYGLRAWNSFLNTMHSAISGNKIWAQVLMNEQMFQSPQHYFEKVRALLPVFKLPSDDNALADLRDKVELEFRLYAERRERLLQKNSQETISDVIKQSS